MVVFAGRTSKEHLSWSDCRVSPLARARVQCTVRCSILVNSMIRNMRSWEKAIVVFDESTGDEQHMCLFPEDRTPPLESATSLFCGCAAECLAPGTAAPVGRMLVGRPGVGKDFSLDSFFAQLLGRQPQRHGLGEGFTHSGDLPVAFAGFGMAIAPGLVSDDGAGGLARCWMSALRRPDTFYRAHDLCTRT